MKNRFFFWLSLPFSCVILITNGLLGPIRSNILQWEDRSSVRKERNYELRQGADRPQAHPVGALLEQLQAARLERAAGYRPVHGPGHRPAGPVPGLHPHGGLEGQARDPHDHQQLRPPQGHARPGKAQVLPGPHRLPHYDLHPEAGHQHQRPATAPPPTRRRSRAFTPATSPSCKRWATSTPPRPVPPSRAS